jgi:molybdopterin-biosynthesis enzyme MoeA-like protein
MNFGLVVIGDEIVSGKRQDKHFEKLAAIMATRGLRFSWVSYLGDDRARLSAVFKQTLSSGEIVFSCGGIGNTPDDHTRQAVAAALGVDLVLHPEAEQEIRARFPDRVTPERLLLGTFPRGCAIIPNPFNCIPGFSVAGTHFFVPGFPQMAWPMLEWVLDSKFSGLFNARPIAEQALLLTGPEAYESALLALMERITASYPDLRLFSLPSIGENGQRRHLELGVEGDPERVAAALEEIRSEVEARGITWSRRD